MFRDRNDAAERLAGRLHKYRGRRDALILAVPRGGLVIGAVLSRELRLPLDIVLAKKIGHPMNSELAIGAVSLTSEQVDLPRLAREGISPQYVKDEIARLRDELTERSGRYRGQSKPLPVADKTVIVVDDGAATGRTLLAAIAIIRQQRPIKIVVAVPVAPAEAAALLALQADEVVSLETPETFDAIGEFYRVFGQVSDDEAARLLSEAAGGALRA
ncbi:MAG: phosphoribosyltransferase [Elusimicrobia bacterium]|nr:phosphoribosyltransferase [Elusimicrobiota bacterium]